MTVDDAFDPAPGKITFLLLHLFAFEFFLFEPYGFRVVPLIVVVVDLGHARISKF